MSADFISGIYHIIIVFVLFEVYLTVKVIFRRISYFLYLLASYCPKNEAELMKIYYVVFKGL